MARGPSLNFSDDEMWDARCCIKALVRDLMRRSATDARMTPATLKSLRTSEALSSYSWKADNIETYYYILGPGKGGKSYLPDTRNDKNNKKTRITRDHLLAMYRMLEFFDFLQCSTSLNLSHTSLSAEEVCAFINAAREKINSAPVVKRHLKGDKVFSEIVKNLAKSYWLANVKAFLNYYLDLNGRCRLFGGRQAELACLSDWLDGFGSHSRILVTGAAGQGKSTLIVNWMKTIPSDCSVVFAPISIRFNLSHELAFYETLVRQLASLADHQFSIPLADPVTGYRAICTEILDKLEEKGAKVLVVIDGLDEAHRWKPDLEFLQQREGIRLLVAARHVVGHEQPVREWLQRLNWPAAGPLATPHLELSRLSRAEALDALHSLGLMAGQTCTLGDLLDELMRLTGGDPLLLGLYVENIVVGGDERFSIDNIRQIGPGLEGFFEEWFRKQEGEWSGQGMPVDAQQAILGVLSIAQAPLLHSELEEVCRILLKNDISYFTRASFEPLSRFLVGDGVQTGYFFQHPRFAQYFREKHFKAGVFITDCHRAIRRWVENSLASLTIPRAQASVSQYVLENAVYYAHASECPREFYRMMLSEVWQAAWLNRRDGLLRYTSEISHLMHDCAQRMDEDLNIKCGLILSSIGSTNTGVPVELLVVLVRHGLITGWQALFRLRLQDPQVFAEGLAVLFRALDADVQEHILVEAESFEDERMRTNVLLAALDETRLAGNPNFLSSVLAYARSVEHLHGRLDLIGKILMYADGETRSVAFNKFIEAYDSCEGIRSLNESVIFVVPVLAEEERASLSERVMKKVTGQKNPFVVAGRIDALLPMLAEKHLDQLVKIALSLEDEESAAQAIVSLSKYLSLKRLDSAIEQIVRRIDLKSQGFGTLKALVIISEVMSAEQLRRVINLVDPKYDTENTCLDLAVVYSRFSSDEQVGLFREMLESISRGQPDWMFNALARISRYVPIKLLNYFFSFFEEHPSSPESVLANTRMIHRLDQGAGGALFSDALAYVSEDFGDKTRSLEVFMALPFHLLPLDLVDSACDAFLNINGFVPTRLNSVLSSVPVVCRSKMAKKLLDHSKSIDFPDLRFQFLKHLSKWLDPADLKEALVIAEEVGDKATQAILFVALSAKSPPEERARLKLSALAECRKLKGQKLFVCLYTLIPLLGEGFAGEFLRLVHGFDSNQYKAALVSLAIKCNLLSDTVREQEFENYKRQLSQLGWFHDDDILALRIWTTIASDDQLAEIIDTICEAESVYEKYLPYQIIAAALPNALIERFLNRISRVEFSGKALILLGLAKRYEPLNEPIDLLRQMLRPNCSGEVVDAVRFLVRRVPAVFVGIAPAIADDFTQDECKGIAVTASQVVRTVGAQTLSREFRQRFGG